MQCIQLFTIVAMIFYVIVPSFADTIKANKTLAEKVLEKYQVIETYHAKWSPTVNDPNMMPGDMTWEVAFDRKNKTVLFSATSSQGENEVVRKLQFLLVVDAANMNAAMDYGNGIEKKSKPIPDPNQLTYRDVRRAIPFIYPFDLPLIFSDQPFMEVIQSRIKEIKPLTKESTFYPGFAIYPDLEGETFAEYKIDPSTLLIEAFRLIHPRSESPAPIFINKSVQINKKLPSDIFDFEKQLEQFSSNPTKKKETDVYP